MTFKNNRTLLTEAEISALGGRNTRAYVKGMAAAAQRYLDGENAENTASQHNEPALVHQIALTGDEPGPVEKTAENIKLIKSNTMEEKRTRGALNKLKADQTNGHGRLGLKSALLALKPNGGGPVSQPPREEETTGRLEQQVLKNCTKNNTKKTQKTQKNEKNTEKTQKNVEKSEKPKTIRDIAIEVSKAINKATSKHKLGTKSSVNGQTSGNFQGHSKKTKNFIQVQVKNVLSSQKIERDVELKKQRLRKQERNLDMDFQMFSMPSLNINLTQDTSETLDGLVDKLNLPKVLDVKVDTETIDVVKKFTEAVVSLKDKIPNTQETGDMLKEASSVFGSNASKNLVYVAMMFMGCAYFRYKEKSTKQNAIIVMLGLVILITQVDKSVLFSIKDQLLKVFRYFSQRSSDDATTNQEEFTTQFDDCEADNILEMIAIAIFSFIVGKAPDGKAMKTLSTELGTFSRMRDGLRDFGKVAIRLIETVVNWVRREILGQESITIMESGIEEIRQWTKEVMEVEEQLRTSTFKLTIPNGNKIHDLWTRGNIMMTKYSRRDGQQYRAQISIHMTCITRLKSKFEQADILSQSTRQVPLTVLIRGPSGVGKSAATIPLTVALLSQLISKEEVADFDMNYETFIYNRINEHVYWDGYRGQFMCVFDDFGQVKDVAGAGDNEYMDFIRSSNLFAYILHMADIESKGAVTFRSKVCLCTTNLRKIHPTSIVEPEAVWRRFDIVVDQVPPEEYCVPSSLESGDLWSRRLDYSKVRGGFDSNAVQYHVYDMKHERYTGEVWTFDQFVDNMKDRFNVLESRFSSYKQDLNNIKNEYLAKREKFETQMGIEYDTPLQRAKTLAIRYVTSRHMNMMLAAEGVQKQYLNEWLVEVIKQINEATRIEDIYSYEKRDVEAISLRRENEQAWDDYDSRRGSAENSIVYQGAFDTFLSPEKFGSRYPSMEDQDTIHFFASIHPVVELCFSTKSELDDWKYGSQKEWEEAMAFMPAALGFPLEPKVCLNILYQESSFFQRTIVWRDAENEALLKENEGNFKNIERPTDKVIDIAIQALTNLMKDHTSKMAFLHQISFKICERTTDALKKAGNKILEYCEKAIDAIKYALSKYVDFRDWVAMSPWGASIISFIELFIASYVGIKIGEGLVTFVKSSFQYFGFSSDEPELDPQYSKSHKNTHSGPRDKKYVRAMKDQATKALSNQMGCNDAVANQVLDKVASKNCYELWVGDKKAGYVTFVRGRIALMPWHFATELATMLVDHPERLNSVLELKKGGDSKVSYKVPLSQFLNAERATAFETQDLCLVAFGTNVPMHTDITKHFVTHKMANKKKDAHFIVCCPNVNTREIWYGNTYTICENKQIGSKDGVGAPPMIVRLGYEYEASTAKGDCGALMLTVDSTTGGRKIMGVHTGGNEQHTRGFATAVTEEDLLETLNEYFADAPIEHMEQADFDYETQFEILDGRFVPLAKIAKGVSGPMRTSLRKSELYGTYKRALTKPAKLRLFTNEQGESVNPYLMALSKYCFPDVEMDEEILDAIAESLYEDIRVTSKKQFEPRILTFDEACLGIEGDDCYLAIPRNTSPGYPHIQDKDPRKPGKTKWFGQEQEYSLTSPECIKLREDCEQLLDKAKRNIRSTFVFADYLKDERRPIEKVNAGKTRIFSAAPLELTVITRQYFGAFTKFILDNRIENGSAVKINCYSDEWNTLARKLRSKGDKVGAGDFSAFDGSEKPRIHWKLLDIINTFYNGTAEEDRIRRILFEEIVNSKHVAGHDVFCWVSSLPSGHPLTTIINCMYNMFAFRYCWLRSHNNYIPSLRNFLDHVYLIVFGDDNAYCISEEKIEIFNQETIHEHMKELGLTYTDEDKTGNIVKHRNLSEISFLKRTFKYEARYDRIVAPLDLDTILEMPMWTQKGPLKDTIVKTTTETALMELSLHGKEVFNLWKEKIVLVYNEHYPTPLSCVSYNLLLQQAASAEISDYFL